MRRFQYSFLALVLVIGLEPLTAAETVKKTRSGICHPPTSSYYDRTQKFQPYDSLGECLAGGGRLPKQLDASDSPTSSQENLDSYERSAFGHGWDDADGDCQDSRAEALITTSSTKVHFATEKRCRVISGRWVSPFTGNVIQNSRDIDIDHAVPLKWAWNRGANEWPPGKREKFANDLVNLWPVESSLNRIKGGSGAK